MMAMGRRGGTPPASTSVSIAGTTWGAAAAGLQRASGFIATERERACGVAVELRTRPSTRSEGPKHSEVNRTRLDHDIDMDRWLFNENWVQCDVNRLSKDSQGFYGPGNDVLFRGFYEKIVEACL